MTVTHDSKVPNLLADIVQGKARRNDKLMVFRAKYHGYVVYVNILYIPLYSFIYDLRIIR